MGITIKKLIIIVWIIFMISILYNTDTYNSSININTNNTKYITLLKQQKPVYIHNSHLIIIFNFDKNTYILVKNHNNIILINN